MTFDVVIRDPGMTGVLERTNKLVDNLDGAKDAAAGATTAITGVTTAARGAADGLAAAGAAGSTSMDKAREATAGVTSEVERVRKATRTATEEYAEFRRILGKGAEDYEKSDKSVAATRARFLAKKSAEESASAGGTTIDAIERERAVLERLKAPMREYMADMQALDTLMHKGTITAVEYGNEFEKLNKKYGVAVQGPVQQVAAAPGKPPGGGGGPPEEKPASGPGFGAYLGAQLAAGAALQLGRQFDAIIQHRREVEDTYIGMANAALKFVDASHGVNAVMNEQMAVASNLHANMQETIGFYTQLKDATRDLKFSHGELIQIETAVGQAVQLANKPIGFAGQITRQLAVAMSDGIVRGDELKETMTEVPAIADAWAAKFGVTRKELVAMANQGRVSVNDLVEAIKDSAGAIDAEFQKRQRTNAQKVDEFTINERLLSQQYDVAEGFGHQAQVMDEMISGGQRRWQAFFADFNEGIKNMTGQFARVRIEQERQWGIQFNERIKTFGRSGNAAAEGQAVLDELAAAGIRTSNSFTMAQASAQQFNQQLDMMLANRGAAKIADDVKRVYDALQGVNDQMDSQFKKWRDISDRINVARGAIDRWKSLTPAGIATSQEQRELEREVRDLENKQKTMQFGDFTVANTTGKLQAADQLKDLARATDAVAVSSEAARTKYRELVTALNDGRLPDAIRIMDKITDPIREYNFALGGLNALWRAGALDAQQYNIQLRQIADAYQQARDATSGTDLYEIERIKREGAAGHLGPRNMGGFEVTRGFEPASRDQPTELAKEQEMQARVTADIAEAQRALNVALADGSSTAILYNQQLERQQALTNRLAEAEVAYEHALQAIAAERGKGLTDRQAAVATREATDALNAARDAADGVGQALNAIIGPQKQYVEQMEALATLRERGPGDRGITEAQYARAADQARLQLLAVTEEGRKFGGAMEAAWLQAKLGAESFGQTLAGVVMQDIDALNGEVIKFEDALVKAAADGEVSWADMGRSFAAVVEGMILDLEKLILKQLEVAAINAIIGSATGNPSAGLATGWLPGFATGGEMVVGGAGGTDSQLVAFRATPGEHVTIQTPGQYRHEPSGGSGSSGAPAAAAPPAAPQIKVINVLDPSTVHAAMDSPTGEQVILNVVRRNQAAVRPTTPRGG